MKENRLGNSDVVVSEIGFGCMSLPLEDAQAAEAILYKALDLGVTFFDTADLYGQGRNEAFVGRTFKSMRHQVVLATKVGNRWTPGQSGWTWDASKAYILRAVEDSLRRLQTDYIDLYQLHGGTIEDSIDDVIEAFESLVQSGKIRAYGISSIRPNVIREYVRKSNIASVMMQYSLLDSRPEETILDLLQKNNISVIARGPVAGGRLSDKETRGTEPYLDHSPETVARARDLLSCLREGVPASQVAIRFALSHPAVATAIPGASREEQLVQNVGAADISPLTPDERAQLALQIPKIVYQLHR